MNDRSPDSSNTDWENPYTAPSMSVPYTVSQTGEPPQRQPAAPQGSRPVIVTLCGLLCLAVFLVFCQTGGYDFVNFDDDQYVYDNGHLNHGFTWDGLLYYTYHWHSYTYHPLTTYSHMLDCQLFGLEPSGHHWVNVVLHAITAALLFLLVRQMTGRLWPSALAAALFALHPLRVESVAWISERKDVLSGLLFVLTLGAYVRYTRAPAAGRYAVVCLLYVLGLLAKPMLVTLPMVLLLLDYWPLRRAAGMRDEGPGTRDEGPGTRDEGPGTRDEGPGTRDEGPGTRDEGPGMSEGPVRGRQGIGDKGGANGPSSLIPHPSSLISHLSSHPPAHLLIEKIPLVLLAAGRFRADRPHPGECHPVAGSRLLAGPRSPMSWWPT